MMLLYEGNRPNPYEIRLNAACLVGTKNLRIYLRNCLHGVTPDDAEITIPIAPPEPVMQFTNLSVETSPSGTRLVKFDYLARYPGLARLRVFHALPGGPPVHKATWPDAFGNGPPASPVTLEFFGPGTVILEGQVCSKVETVPLRLDAPCPTCPPLDSVGDPVSLEGGNMTFTDTDPLPGTGFFSLRRRYDSTASPIDNQYLFGRQFKSPLDSELNHWTTADEQLVVVSDEADLQHTFRRTTNGYINLDRDEKVTLAAASGGSWVMRDETLEREYDATGRIAAYRDIPSGRAVRITYDASGFPSRADDSWGNWAWLITVDPASGLVQSVSVEGAATSVSYTYTSAEQLTTVSTAAGVFRTYEYQPIWNGGVGLVSAVKNGAGQLLESHSYGVNQVALTSVGPSGDIDAIEYNLAGRDTGRAPRPYHLEEWSCRITLSSSGRWPLAYR